MNLVDFSDDFARSVANNTHNTNNYRKSLTGETSKVKFEYFLHCKNLIILFYFNLYGSLVILVSSIK